MDDGGKTSHNQTVLHTRAFTLQEVEFIQTVLKKNFGLRTSPLRGLALERDKPARARLEEKKQDQ
ncbi:hypothetical protein OJ967_27725 (plasmid) [Peribacillus frigoritolerans]|nr:hypothetical protein OJ967_27725 [Peribacillus frigoritolerans]